MTNNKKNMSDCIFLLTNIVFMIILCIMRDTKKEYGCRAESVCGISMARVGVTSAAVHQAQAEHHTQNRISRLTD